LFTFNNINLKLHF